MNVKESALIPLEVLQKVNEALNFCESVKDITIKTNDQYVQANDLFRQLGGHIKAIESERVKTKDPYLQKGREIDSWFKDPQSALVALKSKLELAIRLYQKELEDRRRQEQERLNREAEEKRRKAEEAARIEREKADELRRKAEEADENERQKLLAQAQKAEQKAEAKEEKADTIVAPIAQTSIPNVSGMVTRQNWKFEGTDPIAFAKWAAANGFWHLLTWNQVTCNAHAKSIRQEVVVDGGRFYNDQSLSARG